MTPHSLTNPMGTLGDASGPAQPHGDPPTPQGPLETPTSLLAPRGYPASLSPVKTPVSLQEPPRPSQFTLNTHPTSLELP